jgi:(p)ppGpp synthase/HD superfamily hydrolase
MPINTKLKNGNIVEIITSKNECVPKKEWLENIKTAKAKTEVMKLLSKNQGKEKKKYLVNIISKERHDLLLDITRAFTKTKLNIVSLNTDKKDDDLNIEIVMETSKIAKVEKLINNVKELEGIVNIKVKGEEE